MAPRPDGEDIAPPVTGGKQADIGAPHATDQRGTPHALAILTLSLTNRATLARYAEMVTSVMPIGELGERSMQRRVRLPVLALIGGVAFGAGGGWLANGQEQPVKRTALLKLDLTEIKSGSEMIVWVGDVAPGAATGRHTHPTPRFVYVLEGAVVLEVNGMPPQTFKAGQAFAELPDVVHNLRNASTTELARGLGFQYRVKGEALQVHAR